MLSMMTVFTLSVMLPNEKEEIMYGDIRFVVEKIDKNRIKKVRIFT